MPLPLPVARWALTPPFHPYRPGEPGRRSVFCGTFPGVAPAGRYPAPYFRGARTFLTLPSFDIGKARVQSSSRLTRRLTRPLVPAGQADRRAATWFRDRSCRRPGLAGNDAGRPSRSPWAVRRGAARSHTAAAPCGSRRRAVARRRAAIGFHGKRRPGSILRCGAMSEWPTTLRGSIAGWRARIPRQSSVSASICTGG